MVSAIKEKRHYPEQESTHAEWRKAFSLSVKYNKEKWAHNYQHWVEKGWLKA
jgi:hypothetical protein